MAFHSRRDGASKKLKIEPSKMTMRKPRSDDNSIESVRAACPETPLGASAWP